MNNFRTILFLCFVISVGSCVSKKKVKTRPSTRIVKPIGTTNSGSTIGMLESGPDEIELDMRKSELNLKYKLNKSSIAETFNHVLDTILSSNKIRIEEYNLDVTLIKKEEATIEFNGKSVLINFPLKIRAEKETIIQKLLVEGEMHLTVVTDIEVDKYWHLFTTTELLDFHWIEKPKAKMGAVSIPIEKLMNIVIDRTKSKVVSEIDQTIKKEFALKSQMISVMDLITKPFSIDETSDIELQLDVDSFSMTGTTNTFDWTEGLISISGVGGIGGAKGYSEQPNGLPAFSWLNSDVKKDSSDLYFNIDLELEKINRFVSEKFVGKRFSENGKEITIRKIELKGLDDKLGVIADVTGSYDGQIFLTARPEYDADAKQFRSEDIEINLLTTNVLHKALGWMLKGRIKSELDKTLQFSLKDFLEPIQNQIDKQIQEINQTGELEITANLKDLDVNEFRFSKEKIHAAVHIPMILELKVLDFGRLIGKESVGDQESHNM